MSINATTNKAVKTTATTVEMISNLNVNRTWLSFEGNGDDKIKHTHITTIKYNKQYF